MRTVLSEPSQPTSPQASPPSARSLFSLVLGLIAAYQTVRIFYVQPWLHASSALDRWLAQYDCIVRPLCRQRQFSIDHAGVLLTLLALAAFTLALAGRNVFAPYVHAPPLPAWAARPRLTRIASLLFALTGLEAVVYQTLRMAFAGAAPQPSVWLAGIGAMLLAAAVWDLEDAAVWAQTAAGLTVAGGAALLLVGAAGLFAGNLFTAAAGLLGLALLWLGLRWGERAGAGLYRLDLALALAFALAYLALAMSRAASWEIAFVGDEWIFYGQAKRLMERAEVASILFDTHDTDGYHTVLASALQAWTMQAARFDVTGWRLSSVLPAACAFPAVYYFAYRLGGRTVAWLSAALLAGAHVMLTFTLIPYNNIYALLALCLALAAAVWALAGASILRFMLIGVILGLGFLLHSLTLLVMLPIGVLLAALILPNWRRMAWVLAAVALGMIAAAAPLLLDFAHWQALLKATPAQSEVAAHTSLAAQIARNIVSGAFTFLTDANYRHSHFVVGGRADPFTAVLLLLGLAAALAAVRASRQARAWLTAATVFLLAVSAIQQYGYVAITRAFILLPVFAVFAGLGGAALANLLMPFNPALRQGFLAVIAAAALGFNQFHIEYVSLPRSSDSLSEPALVIRELQHATAANPTPKIVVLEMRPPESRLPLIVEAYGVADQFEVLWLWADRAAEEVCGAGAAPIIVLAPAAAPWTERVQPTLERCWGSAEAQTITGLGGKAVFYRFATAAAQTALPPEP